MNTLSWLLYLADVAPSLGFWFSVVAWICAIMSAVNVLIYAASEGDDEVKAFFLKVPWRFIAATFFLCSIANALIPSKNTIYLIAASELGEEAVKSDAAKKVERYIDGLLGSLPGQQEPSQ